MWYAFLQLHLALQRMYRLRVVYDDKLKIFKVNPKINPINYWTNLQVFFIFVISIHRIGAFLKSTEEEPGQFEKFIMDLLYFGLMVIVLACTYTFQFRRREVVWYMNQIISMKKPSELENKEITVETLAMYSLGGVAIIFPIALATLPFIFNNTPATTVLRFYLPKVIMRNKTVETILSSLYWLIHGFFAVFTVVQILMVIIVVLYDTNFMVKPCYEPRIPTTTGLGFVVTKSLKGKLGKGKDEPESSEEPKKVEAEETRIKPEESQEKKGFKKPNKLKMTVQISNRFPSALITLRKVDLIFKSFQRFGFALFPALIFVAFLLNTVCTYVVIKLNDKLPIIIVAMMAVVDILIFVNTVAIYKFAWVITTEVDKFLVFWKSRLLRKVHQLQLASCRRILIWVGSFFPLHQAITLEHMMQVVDMTTNILLV